MEEAVKEEAGREKPHPLAGRSGVGPPFSPPGWGWRAGYRIRDMYFYSPSNEKFRSRKTLNQYLESTPGSPSPSEFRWNFSPTDYQDGSPLPGNPPTSTPIRRSKPSTPKLPPSAVTPLSTMQVDEDTRLRKFSRLDEEVEQLRRDSIIYEAHTGKRLFINGDSPDRQREKRARINDADDPLLKFLEEGASLGNRSASEIRHLARLIEAKPIDELQECSEEALRGFYRVVRKEDPPAYLGARELAKLCSSWACIHKRTWCVRERSCLFLSRSRREKKLDAHREQLEKLLLASESCKRENCCLDPSFCSGCCCNLCKAPIETNLPWSFIGCRECLHVAHLDCALKQGHAGVAPKRHLDMENLCASCLQTTDLINFWKSRIKDGLASGDEDTLQSNLLAAERISEGTRRNFFQLLHAKIKALRNSRVRSKEREGLVDAVKRVVDSVGEYDDRLLDETVVAEMMQERPGFDVSGEEKKALELQKKAELDYSEWLRAEKLVEGRQMLVRQMQEELGRAEKEAKVRSECAAESREKFRNAEKRAGLVKMMMKMNGVTPGKMVELQKWNCEQEMGKLDVLRKKIEGLSVDKWPVLYKAMDAQDKRLKAAEDKLQQLGCLQALFSRMNNDSST